MMAHETMPTYEEICHSFGFPVPHSYFELLRLAFAVSPENPWNAFDPLELIQLDHTHANPTYEYVGHDYPATPIEVHVIGWTGTDGCHYGFVVDEFPTEPTELPIAFVYPGAAEYQLHGMNIADFVSALIMRANEDDNAAWQADHLPMVMNLVQEFGANATPRFDEFHHRIIIQRMQSGAVLTELDPIGTKVPMHNVDWEFWQSIDWKQQREDSFNRLALLGEADRRLAKGDCVTALLITKNLWFQFWKHCSNDGRPWIERNGKLLEACYAAMGRKHLARKTTTVVDWILKEVVRK